MNRHYLIVLIPLAFLLLGMANAPRTQEELRLWDGDHMAEVRAQRTSAYYNTSYQTLIDVADELLQEEPQQLTIGEHKQAITDDAHNYVSLARYFWPNDSTPDGLPYFNIDGISNPEIKDYDRNPLGEMTYRVRLFTTAWYFSGDKRYADAAIRQLRIWFIQPETRMNPHFEYAQVVRGEHTPDRGRVYGVLDGYSFVEMLDALRLLPLSHHDEQALKAWFADLLQWLLTSELGQQADQLVNNHSIAYDVQVLAYAQYVGDTATERHVKEAFTQRRLLPQIELDGRQPLELQRTRSLWYTLYNIDHIVDFAILAGGLDSLGTQRLQAALDFVLPYEENISLWPYKQIMGYSDCEELLYRNLMRAGHRLCPNRTDYLAAAEKYAWPDWITYEYICRALTEVHASETDQRMAHAMQRWGKMRERILNESMNYGDTILTPRSLNPDGTYRWADINDWCLGFYAGGLWQIQAYTHSHSFLSHAGAAYGASWHIEEAQYHTGSHDIGFVINNTFGPMYKVMGEGEDVLLTAARSLMTRFSPTVGCTRSWDFGQDRWSYPVIIDNMMNLELLFEATRISGDSTFHRAAVSHANRTMENHFRPDYSSYHVVDYDAETGAVRGRMTFQGAHDESVWSRGQAWGLYGFTMCYRFTHDERYLRHAEHIAEFIFSQPDLPADLVPYWDMRATDFALPRDVSAAAITASALYELATYASPDNRQRYLSWADTIISSLSRDYCLPDDDPSGFILTESVGHFPAGSEVTTSIIYADYYYLEALVRQRASR